MNKTNYKTKQNGLFAIIVAYASSIYFPVQILIGGKNTGLPFYLFSAAAVLFSVIVFFRRPKITLKSVLLAAAGFVLVGLYILTGVIYGKNEWHSTQLLSALGRFVPAWIMGIAVSNDDGIVEEMEKYIFVLMLIYSASALISIFNVATTALNTNLSVYNSEAGTSYQDISYFAANAFGLSLFLFTKKDNSVLLKIFLIIAMILQFYCTAAAGGRGGFVLICIMLLYFILRNFSLKNSIKIIVIAIGVIILFKYLSSNIRFEYGFSRITNFFSNQETINEDIRWERYRLGIESFLNSPIIGNGIGSVFYEVGFYSHNIFVDFLCEGGLIYATVLLSLIINTIVKLVRETKRTREFDLLVVIFLSSFVMLLFSSYYFAETGIWFVIAFMLNRKKKEE